MEIVVHSKNSLFQQKFHKKFLGSDVKILSNWTSKVRHKDSTPTPFLLGIQVRLHPRPPTPCDSDSPRLIIGAKGATNNF